MQKEINKKKKGKKALNVGEKKKKRKFRKKTENETH